MPKNLEVKKTNIELFDKTAHRFDEENTELFNIFEQRSLDKRLRKANETCKKHQVCCDLACGTGNLIERQIHEFNDVIGLDISRQMIAICKAKGLGNKACFVVGDAENLPFRDNVFDIVTMHAALHHVPSPSNCFKEIYRVLPKGGIMYVDHEYNSAKVRFRRWKVQGALGLVVETYARKHRNDQPQGDPLVPPEYAIADVQLEGFIPSEVREMLQSRGFYKVKTRYHNVLSPHFFRLPASFKVLSLVNDVLDSFPLVRRYSSTICIWAKK
jgi:ubiquinone/menaquinone biosynthesis C-methylase UbiE